MNDLQKVFNYNGNQVVSTLEGIEWIHRLLLKDGGLG